MNVSGINSNSYAYSTAAQQSKFQQRAQDFKALQSALESGDLSGAQQAFATYQKDLPSQAQNSNSSNQSRPSSQISQDFQSLQSALQSGDLSSAQQAFATLQQDMQSARKAHHGHHHQDQDSSTAAASSTAGALPPSSSVPASTPALNQLA